MFPLIRENAIFNLKLPMKKRLQTVLECKALIEEELSNSNATGTVRVKQLYHDREEFTVNVGLIGNVLGK